MESALESWKHEINQQYLHLCHASTTGDVTSDTEFGDIVGNCNVNCTSVTDCSDMQKAIAHCDALFTARGIPIPQIPQTQGAGKPGINDSNNTHVKQVDDENCENIQENEGDCPRISCLSEQEYNKVPSYLKGRITLSVINNLVQLINQALNTKYSLFNKEYTKLSKKDKNRMLAFKDQETKLSHGREFVVFDDLKKENGGAKELALVPKVVPILRHTKRVEEIRGNNLTRISPLP